MQCLQVLASSLFQNSSSIGGNCLTISVRGTDLLYKTAKNSLYQDAIVHFIAETASNPKITYRIAGDNYLLIEYNKAI